MKYLMGNSDDSIDDGMYSLVSVDKISKEDLLRCKRDNIVIINISNNTIFNHRKNSWDSIEKYEHYTDQWKEK